MCTKMQYNYALKLFIIIRLYKQIEIKINKYYDFHHIYLTILKFVMTFALSYQSYVHEKKAVITNYRHYSLFIINY